MAAFNYSPYMPGYTPTYPQMPQPPQMQQPQQPQGLQGRMVASREEALGIPADFMGNPVVMPDLGHGVIYLKKFDPNTGTAPLYEFKLHQPEETKPVEYAKIEDFMGLSSKVDTIIGDIEKLKKQQKKEV